MILPSLNASNCWNTLKLTLHSVAGNGVREGLKSRVMRQWAISSQTAWKRVEGSTTRVSTLLAKAMGKTSRMGRIFLFVFAFLATFQIGMKTNMISVAIQQHQILDSIIRGIPVDMVDYLSSFQSSTDVSFHHQPMQHHVTLSPSIRMVWPIPHYISSVLGKAGMIRVIDLHSGLFRQFADPRWSYFEDLRNLLSGQSIHRHFDNDVNRRSLAFVPLNPETLHISEYKFLGNSILTGDFDRRSKLFVVMPQFILGDREFSRDAFYASDIVLFHPRENRQTLRAVFFGQLIEGLQLCVIPAQSLFTDKEGTLGWHERYFITIKTKTQQKNNDIVWPCGKPQEDRIKNLSITSKEIKNKGDKVIIRQTPDITIRDYSKGQTLTIERPESPTIEMEIDKAKYFNFICDDIDRHQSDIKLMDNWSGDASKQMKITVDEGALADFYSDAHASNKGIAAGAKSGDINLGTTASPVVISKTIILEKIVDIGTVLDEQNVPDESRWLIIPPWVSGMIKKSDLKDASLTGDGQSILRNGRLGGIDRLTLYLSNLLTSVSDTGFTCWHIIGGQRNGLSFAAQMTEMETLRAESTFGNLVRGLNVYGYKVLKTEAVVDLYVRKGQ